MKKLRNTGMWVWLDSSLYLSAAGPPSQSHGNQSCTHLTGCCEDYRRYMTYLAQWLVQTFTTWVDVVIVKMADLPQGDETHSCSPWHRKQGSRLALPAITTCRRVLLGAKAWSWRYDFNHPPTLVSTLHLSVSDAQHGARCFVGQ